MSYPRALTFKGGCATCGGYGPSSKDKWIVTPPLSQLIKDCTKYVSNLSPFKQYLIFRFTLGSASVNRLLIGLPPTDQSISNQNYWVFLFFDYFHQTGIAEIEQPYKKYAPYFRDPPLFRQLSIQAQSKISTALLKEYIEDLQTLILKAPATTGPIEVFKVAGEYPDLPSKTDFHPKKVKQLPFNSTTINPQFNFAPFLSPEADCCFFVLKIPKGSHVLYVPSEYHAYPFEHEIFLPVGCTFNLKQHAIDPDFKYIPQEQAKINTIQKFGHYQIGPVFELAPDNENLIRSKKMNLFKGTYIKP